MIEFDKLTFRYPGEQSGDVPILSDTSLSIEAGDLVLVVGPSGSGKSTLLRCINGLIPHFYGGTVSGRARVFGQDPIVRGPRQMSGLVGFVFQDPEAQAVVDMVEDELAFAMENQGVSRAVMRKRIEQVLDQLGIAHLRHRKLSTLSGGERQRVAIAAVLTLQPQVLVLDEPTSQLDPQAAEEVLDVLVNLNHDLGLTIVLSEHRLERVVQYADKILYVAGRGQQPVIGEPSAILAQIPLVPPLVELGKQLGWLPLPLTIEEARKRLAGITPSPQPLSMADRAVIASGESVLSIQGVCFAYNGTQTLHNIDLTVPRGEFLAIMGRNGAGKSTLLKHCIGLLKPDEGRVSVLGLDTRNVPVVEIAMHVGYVPQNPNALLFADTVRQELEFTRQAQGLPTAVDEPLLEMMGLGDLGDRYPRDLSVGERQRVALACVLVGDPDLVLLDEPTRGLDYEQKELLIALLETQRQRGKTIIVVTHDVELVARCAERVVLMGDGEIVVDGPVREVMSGSQVFASQINRLFRDPQYLTVQDVVGAIRQGA